MLPNETFVKHNQKYYILANSTYVDDITRILNFGDSFAIFDRWGDANPIGKNLQGIYYKGTRYLNEIKLSMNGMRPFLLSSTIRNKNELISVDLTNPLLTINPGNDISHGNIHINRNMFLQEGLFYERIECTNHSLSIAEFTLELECDADFKDIFEIRGTNRKKVGTQKEPYLSSPDVLSFEYVGLDNIPRRTNIKVSPKPHQVNNKKAIYGVSLQPAAKFQLDIIIGMEENDEHRTYLSFDEAFRHLEKHTNQFNDKIGVISTSDEKFNEWIVRSNYDLMSLLAPTPFGAYPYAGVPWFNTPFGRDGIITALFTLWIAPFIAKGVLEYLAHHQATTVDPFSDAEPGKILHESRFGEMANCKEIPFLKYYGSVDSTPLFIVLAGRYLKRTADFGLIQNIYPQLENAILWLENYADVDGDGFYEYIRKEKSGLYNQGWKDSGDSISHQDGTLANLPIALCEVQAYVIEAYRQMSYISEQLGKTVQASYYQSKSDQIFKQFNERFWSDELKTFVLALDENKKPCMVKASNVGHALFCNAVDERYAKDIMKLLMSDKMFTGWGIRTLATDEVRYNPMSYHNGSVWPFDTAIAAAGLAKYGFSQQAATIMTGLFETSQFVELNRLPELFCGFEKRVGEGPTAYPVACSPQAWSVASIYMLIQSILNIEIDALEKTIHLNFPMLPEYLDDMMISHIPLNDDTLTFKLKRFKSTIGLDLLHKPAEWKIFTVK